MASWLLDTNVVGRLADVSAPEHPVVLRAVTTLLGRGETLLLAPQVLVELWVVATRPPAVNGFGWSAPAAASAIAGLRQQFPMPDDGPAVFDRWWNLVQSTAMIGKHAHDARIAAFMLVHGIPSVLTFNTGDFVAFPGVTATDPHGIR